MIFGLACETGAYGWADSLAVIWGIDVNRTTKTVISINANRIDNSNNFLHFYTGWNFDYYALGR